MKANDFRDRLRDLEEVETGVRAVKRTTEFSLLPNGPLIEANFENLITEIQVGRGLLVKRFREEGTV